MDSLICYASRTGTRRNLDALRDAGWRLLISRTGVWRTEGFAYALDNGRWTDSQETPPRAFDIGAQADFMDLITTLGPGADFIVIPDTVGLRDESLQLTREWLPRVRAICPDTLLLIAVQDGMTPDDIADLVGPRVGVFLGGSTEWKLATMEMWGAWCAAGGYYYHVARVNTAKRFALAIASGAHSIDGSSASRFSKSLPRLVAASQRRDLFSPGALHDRHHPDRRRAGAAGHAARQLRRYDLHLSALLRRARLSDRALGWRERSLRASTQHASQ